MHALYFGTKVRFPVLRGSEHYPKVIPEETIPFSEGFASVADNSSNDDDAVVFSFPYSKHGYQSSAVVWCEVRERHPGTKL